MLLDPDPHPHTDPDPDPDPGQPSQCGSGSRSITTNFIVIELLIGPEVHLRETGVPGPVFRGSSDEGPLVNGNRRSVLITINAPLILKMRDIIFFCGQTT